MQLDLPRTFISVFIQRVLGEFNNFINLEKKSMKMQSLAKVTKKYKLELGITSISINLIFMLSIYYFDVPRKVVFKLS